MEFRNAKQMLQYVISMGAYWSPKAQKYVWAYSEAGAIAVANVQTADAIRFAAETLEWEENLRGSIYEAGSLALERCEELFAEGPWFTPKTMFLNLREEYQKEEEVEDRCYKLYQLQWMREHSYSLEDIFARVDCNVADALSAFEEVGFEGGEIYSSKKEFLATEYLNEEYMLELLQDQESLLLFWLKWREESKEKGRFETLIVEDYERGEGYGEGDFLLRTTDELIAKVSAIRKQKGMNGLDEEDWNCRFYLDFNAEKRLIQLSATCNRSDQDEYEKYDIPLSEEEREFLLWKIIRELDEYA